MNRSQLRCRRTVSYALVASALALVGSSRVASAQEGSDIEGGKQGPIMVNAKIGPAIGIADFSKFTAFALELEGGYAILGREGYVTFSPSFAFGAATVITLPVGFQYEFGLPVDNLSVYGRATVGVGFETKSGYAAFHIGPHAGAKYQITPMFHAGLEPISLPMYFGDGGVGMHYRILAYGGADF